MHGFIRFNIQSEQIFLSLKKIWLSESGATFAASDASWRISSFLGIEKGLQIWSPYNRSEATWNRCLICYWFATLAQNPSTLRSICCSASLPFTKNVWPHFLHVYHIIRYLRRRCRLLRRRCWRCRRRRIRIIFGTSAKLRRRIIRRFGL
jgi:hypothetical protein